MKFLPQTFKTHKNTILCLYARYCNFYIMYNIEKLPNFKIFQ